LAQTIPFLQNGHSGILERKQSLVTDFEADVALFKVKILKTITCHLFHFSKKKMCTLSKFLFNLKVKFNSTVA